MSRRVALGVLLLGLVVLLGVPIAHQLTPQTPAGVGALPVSVLQAPVGPNVIVGPDPVHVYSGTSALTPAKVQPAAVELTIPSVGISTPIDSIGVTATGIVAIPADARRVGWYRFGPTPGDAHGSSVIVGHVDSLTQGLGALFPLKSVHLGDLIKVRRADWSVVTYQVVERRLYLKQGLPWPLFFSSEGPARLTVITCGGPYLRGDGGYQDNLIVTALPLTSMPPPGSTQSVPSP
jgi:hypothetical protein